MLLIINNWTHFAIYKIITIFQSWQTSTNLSLNYTNVPSEFSERDIGSWRLQVIRESYLFILSWAWGVKPPAFCFWFPMRRQDIRELCNRPRSLWSPCGSVVECGIGRSEVQFLIGTQIFFLCPTLSSWQDEKTSCSISLPSSKPSLLFNKFKFKVHQHYQNQYQDTLLTCQPAKNQLAESISQY